MNLIARRIFATAVAMSLAPALLAQGLTERITVTYDGLLPGGNTDKSALSHDGRYVAFRSTSSHLVPGTTSIGVYVRDRQSGTTECVSLDPSGAQAPGQTATVDISADARYVVFDSTGASLAPGDTNGTYDVYRRDRATGTTVRVSQTPGGAPGNDASGPATVSPDGRFVAFLSYASDLVPGDTNGRRDVFLADVTLGTVERVSVAGFNGQSAGEPAFDPLATVQGPPVVSADGRYVVFDSRAPDLVPGDTNDRCDIFVRDRVLLTTTRVNLAPGGVESTHYSTQPSLSADGRWLAFRSAAQDLVAGDTSFGVEVFRLDLTSGITERVSVSAAGVLANAIDDAPKISADGRFVAFASVASNLVLGDIEGFIDVFRHDMLTGATTRVSVDSNGTAGNEESGFNSKIAISGDGRTVAFASFASNLTPGGGGAQLYVHEASPHAPVTYGAATPNSQGCQPTISSTGTASYGGTAPFLVRGDNLINRTRATFVRSLAPGRTPFQGATFWIGDPITREQTLPTGGNPTGIDCSGASQIDFNAVIRSGLDPSLVPGTVVHVQIVFYDRHAPFGRGATNALVFTIEP